MFAGVLNSRESDIDALKTSENIAILTFLQHTVSLNMCHSFTSDFCFNSPFLQMEHAMVHTVCMSAFPRISLWCSYTPLETVVNMLSFYFL